MHDIAELRRYVRDLIRVDHKLIFYVNPLEDGTVELRRMRLASEDREGNTCEYVTGNLISIDIETEDQCTK